MWRLWHDLFLSVHIYNTNTKRFHLFYTNKKGLSDSESISYVNQVVKMKIENCHQNYACFYDWCDAHLHSRMMRKLSLVINVLLYHVYYLLFSWWLNCTVLSTWVNKNKVCSTFSNIHVLRNHVQYPKSDQLIVLSNWEF